MIIMNSYGVNFYLTGYNQGILLRRLEGDSRLQGVTHVVVDEVHERSIESDFLLIILRHLCKLRPDIKYDFNMNT